MTEVEQDRDTMATGTTVIASSVVIDTDDVRARGVETGPGRPEQGQDEAPPRPDGGDAPDDTDDDNAPDDEPEESPPGFRRELWRVAREHSGAATAAAIALLLLLAGAVAGTGLAIWAFREKAKAEKAEHEAVARSKKAEETAEQYKGKFHQKEAEWKTALKELRQVRAAEAAEKRLEEQTRAILDFLRKNLLTAGRPGNVSLEDAFWTGGQGKDVTMHKALDVAESRVDESFSERPLAEAAVREMLGLAYLSVGDSARAIKQYERALTLREAEQGFEHPETSTCRNQLAVAFRVAGRDKEAALLFDRNPFTPDHASALVTHARMLLLQKKPAEAELMLRQCLHIRRKIQRDDWKTFETESLLGEALLEQRKFADAEPVLLSGYEGLKAREDRIPPEDRIRLTQALRRVVSLYEAWGYHEQALKWRAQLEAAGVTKS